MKEILNFEYTKDQKNEIEELLKIELKKLDKKIIVLDDDPTGTQTVNDIMVYCDWEKETISEAINENNRLFFILTNSRSFSEEKTITVHKEIIDSIIEMSEEKNFFIYSRGDSTLRGHYPIETETLKAGYEENLNRKIDGEIICPFFFEGKRVTIDGVHYILSNEELIPVGETEFAKDKSFLYKNSDLAKWCEEKSKGKFQEKKAVKIKLEDIREMKIDEITKKLLNVSTFNKIIVDSVNYYDLKIFAICFLRAIYFGKEYIIRGAASLVKVLSACKERELLTRDDILNLKTRSGGIIIIGSHVTKTTEQLEELKKSSIIQLEFNQHLVLDNKKFEKEIERVTKKAEEIISQGKDIVIYTKRKRLDISNGTEDEQLKIAAKISRGLIDIIKNIKIRPAFIIAKGGITSSDTATKGLGIRKAKVLGQLAPGIPVWLSGKESKYPDLPYIVFPGNVGEKETLLSIYEEIASEVNENRKTK